jgi:hypothetical protein
MDGMKRSNGIKASHAFRVSYVVTSIFAVMLILTAVATVQFQSVNHVSGDYAGSRAPGTAV